MPDDLKKLDDAQLAQWTAQWDVSSQNRLLGEQEQRRRASSANYPPTPRPKWYESSLGKIAFSVFFAVLGAATGWAILRWTGVILGP